MNNDPKNIQELMEKLKKKDPNLYQLCMLQEVKGYVSAIKELLQIVHGLFGEKDIDQGKFVAILQVMAEAKAKEAELIAK